MGKNSAPEGQNTDLPEGENITSLRDQIFVLEGKIVDLQRELEAQEDLARRGATSDAFMLAELKKASEQLVCEYSNSTPFIE